MGTRISKLKVFLRKAAARTIDDLRDVIRDALPIFTPQDCANYFTTAAGYEPECSASALAIAAGAYWIGISAGKDRRSARG